MSDAEIVEPTPITPLAEARRLLREAGCPDRDVEWLAEVLLDPRLRVRRPRRGEDADSHRIRFVESVLLTIEEAFEGNAHSRDAALLEVLLRLSKWHSRVTPLGHESASRGTEERPLQHRIFRRLLPLWTEPRRGIDFRRAILESKPDPESETPRFFTMALRRLVRKGLLRPRDFVEARTLRDTSRSITRQSIRDVRNPEFWLEVLGPAALDHLLPLLEVEPEETIGDLAHGFMFWIGQWGLCPPRHVHPWNDDPLYDRCAPHLEGYFRVLHAHLSAHRGDLRFLGAYWWFARRALKHRRDAIDQATRRTLLDSAMEALGSLRAAAREATAPGVAMAIGQAWESYLHAAWLVVHQDGLWPAFKQLLLALRSMSVPAVAEDLRFWAEGPNDAAPPQPWSRIPEAAVGLIHGFAGRVQESDPALLAFRREFAAFCLKRLLPSKEFPRERAADVPPSGEWAPIEQSTAARRCYIRAVGELCVNPRGRGHHTLFLVFKNDPDRAVRAEAERLYAELRRGKDLEPGTSPRRAVMAAFWWIRQAHLLALGSRIDPEGAQRTRQREMRRTREPQEVPTS